MQFEAIRYRAMHQRMRIFPSAAQKAAMHPHIPEQQYINAVVCASGYKQSDSLFKLQNNLVLVVSGTHKDVFFSLQHSTSAAMDGNLSCFPYK